jgi:hypothetical protein
MSWTWARRGRKEKCINLIGKPEGKNPLARPRNTWEDNVKIYLIKIGYGVDSSGSG